MPEENSKEQIRPEAVEAVRKYAEESGFDKNSFKANLDFTAKHNAPLEDTGLQQDFEVEDVEYEQSFIADLGSSFANSLILDTGEGLSNLIPTIAQAAGDNSDFIESWKSNVSSYFDDQKMVYSDSSNQEIDEFGDINSSHVATGIGQGLGFIASILAGGAGAGKIASTLGNSTKIANAASKMGTFFMGTTMMYPGIEKEARSAGLNNNDAARFALSVSALVSLTEGAALESIGKVATKPLTNLVAGQVAKKTLKEAAKDVIKNPKALEKLFLKNYSKKFSGAFNKGVKSAGIEMGQEFSQTYIENGAKNLYDVAFEGENKGNFGTDVTSYKTFVEATFAGAIGGLLGGGMGVTMDRASSKGESLAEESLFGYINSSVKLGKEAENIDKLTSSIDEMVKNGEVTEVDSESIKNTINDLTQFSKDTNLTNVEDGVAQYQLYQLDSVKKDISKARESIKTSDSANETIRKEVEDKKSKIELVEARAQEHFNNIFENKKPETDNKTAFESKIDGYKSLAEEINRTNPDEEIINKKLDRLFNPTKIAEQKAEKVARKEAKASQKTNGTDSGTSTDASTDIGKSHSFGNNISITDKALNNREEFKNDMNAALDSTNDMTGDDVATKYGMDKESLSYLHNNPKTTIDNKVENKEAEEPVFKESGKGTVEDGLDNELSKSKEEIEEAESTVDSKEKTESKEEPAIGQVVEEKESPLSKMTDDELDAVALDENITESKKKDIAKEKAKRNEVATKVEFDRSSALMSKLFTPQEQRKSRKDLRSNDSLVKDNPKLYNKITERFGKIFPNIPVTEVDGIVNNSGSVTLGRVVESGIEINPKEALQSTIIHEYGHIYLDVLEKNNSPLLKVGYKFIEGTQFFKDAQELYPNLSKEAQLNEALNEALAQDSLEKLKVKLEGSALDKFLAFAKKFWKNVKSFFGKEKAGDIIGILSDSLIAKNTVRSVGLGSLTGMNMEQRKSIAPEYAETVTIVSKALTLARLQNVENKQNIFDTKNVRDITLLATQSLFGRYYAETNNLKDYPVKVFKGFDMDVYTPSDISIGENSFKDMQSLGDAIQNVENEYSSEEVSDFMGVYSSEANKMMFDFGTKVKQEFPDVYKYANNVIESMIKTPIDLDSLVVEEVDEANAIVDGESKPSGSAIKGSKKINESVRSVLSTMVNQEGYKVNVDNVQSYIARVAENTKGKEGFLNALKSNVINNNDLIAQRTLDIIDMLSEGQKAGFLKTITSLIQVKAEGSNASISVDEDGNVKANLRNPIKNKTEHSATENIKSWVGSEKAQDFFSLDSQNKRVGNYNVSELKTALETLEKVGVDKLRYDLNPLYNQLSQMFGEQIDSQNIENIIAKFDYKNSQYSPATNFYYALFGNKASIKQVLKDESDIKTVSGFIENISEVVVKDLVLKSTYLNGASNMVGTTQTGHWVSDLSSWIFNEEGRMDKMKKSPIYKNNSVLKYFEKKGNVNYIKPDSMKNLLTNENIEHAQQSLNDHHVDQFHKFATNTSNDYYMQSVGVLSNRDNKLMFEVPTYSTSQLKEEYANQVETLQAQFNKQAAKLTPEQLVKLEEDFNNLYIHSVKNGKVTSGYGKHQDSITEIKKVLNNNDLTQAYAQQKVGKDKKFATMNDMLENYFYTEALNRNYLADIYAGPALLHSKPTPSQTSKETDEEYKARKSKAKGAVESFIKRMSALNSNGETIELKKPVRFVVYKGGSDSFAYYGPDITAEVKEYMGTFDPLGFNSKFNTYQVDPITGESLYVKTSNLNVENVEGGTNLDGMGEGMKRIGLAISKLDAYFGEEANVIFLDSDSFKGTYSGVKPMNLEDILKATEKGGDISSIEKNFSPPVKIDGMKTPFNMSKKLDNVDKQSSILSTQLALIQFYNKDISAIEAFESIATNHLQENMDGKGRESKVYNDLVNFNYVLEELTKDLNDRDKSATTDILDAIKSHNENNPDDAINSFDHPSLKPIYEQFVSSRLAKKGIRLELAGNFMHQLPDMHNNSEEKLQHEEVAVSWKMFFNEKPTPEQEAEFLASADNKVVAVRIPASAPLSTFAGKVKYFLDADTNVVKLSDDFVKYSDSDHDGDKAMIYRKEMNQDGSINNDSTKTQMFNNLYTNLSSVDYIEATKKEEGLSFEEIKGGKLNYKSGLINDIVDITTKMGLGASATGRFAIAGKLMSLLSQSKEGLKNSINFEGKTLQEFTNDSLDDVALFLQAALDIGNNPILTTTGFTQSTIDVGNAMLLLGLNKDEVIEFLNRDDIKNLSEEYENTQLAFGGEKNLSFKQFLNNKYGMEGDVATGDVAEFMKFREVADGLTKVIGYIQLDKNLPNNSQKNQALIDNITDFEKLPFTFNQVSQRQLLAHREEILNLQNGVFETQLLSSPEIKSIVKELSEQFTNKFEFQKRVDEQLMHYFSQSQISNKVDSASDFIYDFSAKMKTIYDAAVLGKGEVEIESYLEAIIEGRQTKEFYATHYGMAEIEKSLEKVKADKLALKVSDRLKGNSVIKYLEFKTLDDGKLLVSLNPKYKATEQSKKEFKQDFLKIQEILPDLAREIKDYQLLRYGLNNRMGSFIDGLPMDMNIKGLKRASTLINNPYSVNKNSGVIRNNLVQKNKDLLKVVSDNQIEMHQGKFQTNRNSKEKYLMYNNEVYSKGTDGNYSKTFEGKFETDENFTRYNLSNFEVKATKEQAITKLENCK